MKPKLAIVRGKFLNAYEMQIFEPLIKKYDITAFGSKTSYHNTFAFPSKQLWSPMDLPESSFKLPLINRMFIDGHYLFGLEQNVKGFDIIHTAETYYHYTQQALNAKKKGYVKKVVATVLENIPFNNEGIWGRKFFKNRSRQELDHIIALTEKTKQTLILEGADEKKITVISHGIDTKRFFSRKETNKTNKITILFTGRLEVYKGVYEILYAFKRLLLDQSLKNYKLQLLMIGDGSEKEKLIKLEQELKITKHIKHKSVSYNEMPSLYQQADIYVAPSKAAKYWIEQYNTGLLEAQASGLPIVTTYSGGIPENVGNAATLVQPDDFVSIYLALKDFIVHPGKKERFGKLARQRAENVHDTGIIADKLDRVYKTLL